MIFNQISREYLTKERGGNKRGGNNKDERMFFIGGVERMQRARQERAADA